MANILIRCTNGMLNQIVTDDALLTMAVVDDPDPFYDELSPTFKCPKHLDVAVEVVTPEIFKQELSKYNQTVR